MFCITQCRSVSFLYYDSNGQIPFSQGRLLPILLCGPFTDIASNISIDRPSNYPKSIISPSFWKRMEQGAFPILEPCDRWCWQCPKLMIRSDPTTLLYPAALHRSTSYVVWETLSLIESCPCREDSEVSCEIVQRYTQNMHIITLVHSERRS